MMVAFAAVLVPVNWTLLPAVFVIAAFPAKAESLNVTALRKPPLSVRTIDELAAELELTKKIDPTLTDRRALPALLEVEETYAIPNSDYVDRRIGR